MTVDLFSRLIELHDSQPAADPVELPAVTLEIHDGGLDTDGCYNGRAIVTGGDIILDYTREFGVHIFRPASEVFKPVSMDSIKLIPLTDGHPPKNLTAADIQKYAIGWTGEQVTRIGNKLAVNFKITDSKIAQAVADAKRAGRRVQFSIGAKARPERIAGEFNGQSYQVSLHDIVYNHLALLLYEQGRHPGTDLLDSLNDSTTAEDWLFLMDGLMTATDSDITTEGKTVKKRLPNGFDIEVVDAEASYLDNHLVEHQNLKTQLATKEGENTTLKRQLEQAQGQVMDSTKENQLIADRLKLAAQAKPLLTDKTIEEIAAMDAISIQEAVIIADGATADDLAQEKIKWGEQYPAYLAGSFERALESKGQQVSQQIKDGAGRASTALRDGRSSTPADQPENKRAVMRKKLDDACKGANR